MECEESSRECEKLHSSVNIFMESAGGLMFVSLQARETETLNVIAKISTAICNADFNNDLYLTFDVHHHHFPSHSTLVWVCA
jgi:hypothetical protein